MANDGIEFKLNADARDAIEGIEDVGQALEKVQDNLGDVGKGGDKELDKLEKDLKSLDRAALKTGDELDKALGKKTKRAAEEASDGINEFKDEANSTAREAAASFDGSAASIVDAFQEVAANAFAGFGPAGALAGLGIAAGIGIGVKAIDDMNIAAENVKQRISDMTGALIEGGGQLDITFLVDNFKQLATSTEDGKDNLVKLKQIADRSGQSFNELANAVAGNVDNYDELIAKSEEYTAQQDRALSELTSQYSAASEVEKQLQADRLAAAYEYTDKLKEAKKVADDAAQAEQLYEEAGVSGLEARAAISEQLNQAYDDAASSVEGFLDVEAGTFDTTAYVDAMLRREQALADYQTALATTDLDASAKAFLASQGEEVAATMLSGYNNSSPEIKAQLKRIWSEAGKDSSGNMMDEIDKELQSNPADIQTKADTSGATQDIRNWVPPEKVLKVLVEWRDKKTGAVIP